MRNPHTGIILATAVALAFPGPCVAQGPGKSFTQLVDLLKPGDTVWVTDATGREVKGKIASVTSEALALDGSGAPAVSASDVRLVRRRDPGRGTWTGGAVGAVAGLGAGIAVCATYPKDDPLRGDACMMSIGLLWMPGLGAGALVGAMFPGKKQEVYRAPTVDARAAPRVSITPVVTPRAKGVALAFSF
jgi:hypothetical protein